MNLRKIYRQLSQKYGPQDWWPLLDIKMLRYRDISARGGPALGRKISRKKIKVFSEKNMFEVCLGAILTQNTNWKNVEKAILNLKRKKILSPRKILNTPPGKLRGLIRSSGYYNEKTKKLMTYSLWLMDNYKGSLKKFFKQSLKKCREELLAVHGIGPETADSILLYAGRKPSFVIDAYTRRLCKKYGVEFKTYDEYKEYFEKRLPKSYKLYNEFHALIVQWGKNNSSIRKVD
ncbi:MAG: endonuclease III domain-containing protein [Patescibacteria group bacterium]